MAAITTVDRRARPRPGLHAVHGRGPRPPTPAVARRRRVGVGVVVVAALLALLGSLAAAPSTPADGAQLGPPVVAGQVYVAQSGDTYWSIAARLGAGGDVRATVDALEAANEGRLLRAGDRLELPP